MYKKKIFKKKSFILFNYILIFISLFIIIFFLFFLKIYTTNEYFKILDISYSYYYIPTDKEGMSNDPPSETNKAVDISGSFGS